VRPIRELNTISLQANSVPSLVLQETAHIPDSFYRARVEVPWPEWREILEALPAGPLRDRLREAEGKTVHRDLQRGILSDAIARGEAIPGASLVKGSHVRLR